MKKDVHKIDELFKKAIEDQQADPPAGVWNSIDQELDKSKVISILKKYNYLKRVAVALFIFCFMASVYALYLSGHNIKANDNNISDKINKGKLSKEENNHQETVRQQIKKSTIEDKENAKETRTLTQKQNSSDATVTTVETRSRVEPDQTPAIIENDNKQISGDLTEKQNRKSFREKKYSAYNLDGGLIISKKYKQTSNDIALEKIKVKKDLKTINGKDASIEKTAQQPSRLSFDPFLKHSLISINNLTSKDRTNIVLGSTAIASNKGIRTINPLSISLYFSSETAKNHIRDVNPTRGTHDDFRTKEQTTSINTGLIANYDISSKWSLKSGIIYSSSTASISPKTIYAQPDNRGHIGYEFHCSAGYSYVSSKTGSPNVGDSTKALSSKSNLQYLSVPLALDYIFRFGKLSIRPSLGVAANFLLKGKVETTLSSGYSVERIANNDIQGLKSSYLSSIASIGAEYSLNKVISISVSPMGRFALSSINNNTPVKTYPSYFGLSGGMRFSF